MSIRLVCVFFKQKAEYEVRISGWSADVCSSDLAPRASEIELHALLHGQLDLTPEQERKLERIEADFAGRRQALELEMRAANVRLAQAIEAEHGYGPRVTEAIDETHEVMGTLQKIGRAHV